MTGTPFLEGYRLGNTVARIPVASQPRLIYSRPVAGTVEWLIGFAASSVSTR